MRQAIRKRVSLVDAVARTPLGSIDHITHIENLESILMRGLHAHNNEYQQEDISNKAVNLRRARREPVNGKRIHSYVPLYFNAKNAMLYRVQKENKRNIIILGYDTSVLKNALITDGNAACTATRFLGDYSYMSELDWDTVFSRSWSSCEETKREMMAEALVPHVLETKKLRYIYCQDAGVKAFVEAYYDVSGIDVIAMKNYFF